MLPNLQCSKLLFPEIIYSAANKKLHHIPTSKLGVNLKQTEKPTYFNFAKCLALAFAFPIQSMCVMGSVLKLT